VRLHDRGGQVLVDTEKLDDTIEVSELAPIVTEAPQEPVQKVLRAIEVSELAPIVTETPQEPVQKVLRERVDIWVRDKAHNLPWRKSRRAALRRDLKADLRTALTYAPR